MKRTWFASVVRRGVGGPMTALVGALALLLATSPLVAQEGAVTGRVVEATTLQPVQGAQVFIPNTNLGALTGEDGRYRIEGVSPGSWTVQVRIIGYRTASQEVQIQAGQTATADFELEVTAVSMDELVITAVGEQRRREVGNAIADINAEEIVGKRNPTTFDDLLQGQATGVSVRRSSGSVGTGNDLKIRGVTSITLDNTPLVFIDGARVSNNNDTQGGINGFFVGGQGGSRLNDLNPEDIESIEIVKGPSAATLYGTEAAAGVILIRTKRGTGADRAQWRFRAGVGGTQDVTDWPAVAYNPTDDPTVNLPFAKDTVYTMNLMEGSPPGIDDPFRTGLLQRYAGSVRGGFDIFNYFGSMEYRQDNGNLPANNFTQWSVRGNFRVTPSDNVTIDISNGYVSNDARLPDNDNNGSGYIGNALLGLGFLAPFDRPDPNDPGEPIRTCPLAFELARAGAGDLASLSEGNCGTPFLALGFDDIALFDNRQGVERYTGSGTVTWNPLPFWTNRFTVGYDQFSETTQELTPVVPRLVSTDTDFLGDLELFIIRDKTVSLEATSGVEYGIPLGDDLVGETTVGMQYGSELTQGLAATGEEFPAGSPSISNAVTTNTNDFTVETRTIGIFVQQQFSWQDRIFVTPAVRFDDNSASGENLGIQTLPRVQFSWLMSEDEWFPDFFDDFRLRGAWGESGIQPGSNAALAILNAISTQVEGSEILGVTPNQPPNPDLSAARSEEFEGGFDASVLDGRLGLAFTYYNQTTNDDVVAAALAPSTGFPNQQFRNIGQIKSKGIEAALDASVLRTDDVSWDWRVQLTTNDGEITRLDNPIIFGLGGSSQRHAEGLPFGAYVTEEVIVDSETGEARVLTCEEDPTDCVRDQDGEFDGNNRLLGQPTPEWEGSVASTLGLFNGRVTLYGLVDFQGGHQLFNSTEEFRTGFVVGLPTEIYEMDAEGNLTDAAKIKRHAAAVGSEGPWIEDADFAKLRSVSLRVDLPESFLGMFGARNGSLTLSGENLVTWTGYTGLDPELNFAGGAGGIRADFLTLPPARSFRAQVSVGF